MVARLDNRPTHEVVEQGLTALLNLEHRGAAGADPGTGDGAGVLVQLPHEFFVEETSFELPGPGQYGVGMCFLPTDEEERRTVRRRIEDVVR
ncbi:MAG: hypothetical protein ACKOGM_08405, partial [Solirubrobacterales bacterium]